MQHRLIWQGDVLNMIGEFTAQWSNKPESQDF